MLNLEALTGKRNRRELTGSTTALFYQTEECKGLLEEAMKFEGMDTPFSQECTDTQVADAITGVESHLLLIEVANDIVDVAKRIHPLVPRHTRVILVGRQDSILAMRTIGEIGFYYIYWPATKEDIVAFLRKLKGDQVHNKGPQVMRSAKRIAVVAAKGGSGCTMVTTELAHSLVRETQQQVIIADHGYHGSNMHIMLGQRNLPRRPISEEAQRHHTLGNMLDHVGAQSQLTQVNSKINYLGFEADTGTGEDMREYTSNILEALRRDANFIIEDFSASVNFYPDPTWLCPAMDCVVVLVQPSLSSLHETRSFLEAFKRVNEQIDNPTRLIVMLNNCRPKASIGVNAVEQYLQLTIDIELPYFKQCEEYLAAGKRFVSSRTSLTKPFINLSRQILGKPLKKSLFFSDRAKTSTRKRARA